MICSVINEQQNDIKISTYDLCDKFNKYKELETGRGDTMTPQSLGKLIQPFSSFITDSKTGSTRFKKLNINSALLFFNKTREDIIQENQNYDFVDDKLLKIFS